MQTIATFSKPEEAHLLRMRLEAVGFPAFVFDENMVQMDWFYSNAIGGVRVQVNDEDVDAVREFLQADNPSQEEMDTADLVCPVCGSSETAQDELPRRIAYAFWFLQFPLLIFGVPLFYWLRHRPWVCKDCKHQWSSI